LAGEKQTHSEFSQLPFYLHEWNFSVYLFKAFRFDFWESAFRFDGVSFDFWCYLCK
jgi:hypothetical protein